VVALSSRTTASSTEVRATRHSDSQAIHKSWRSRQDACSAAIR
jgi:hypothetical protein